MPRHLDSGRLDLAKVFLRVQRQMQAQLAVGQIFEHPTPSGDANEKQWLDLLHQYLPQRYRASSAFVIDADGRRSRQIDIAIYDALYSPLLFPHESGLHIPVESLYAVFEVKRTLSHQWLRDAAAKAASVRCLRRTSTPMIASGRRCPAVRPAPILAGVLAVKSVWRNSFYERFPAALRQLSPAERLDLGCILSHGAFEVQSPNRQITKSKIRLSSPHQALVFFILRLLDRLRALGTAPAADLRAYARSVRTWPC